MSRPPKILALTAMHGRHYTLKYCFDKMPFLEKVVVYSDPADGEYLQGLDIYGTVRYANRPLSNKWNAGLKAIRYESFDAVIMLGSDDYIDRACYDFICEKIQHHDVIGFSDIYLEKQGKLYYWSGYENSRKGEPIGAGRVFRKDFLEKIRFDLWKGNRNRGLDKMSWRRVISKANNILTASIKEEGLLLVDVKNEKGLNTFDKMNRKLNLIPQ